jgi:hypothetical protein
MTEMDTPSARKSQYDRKTSDGLIDASGMQHIANDDTWGNGVGSDGKDGGRRKRSGDRPSQGGASERVGGSTVKNERRDSWNKGDPGEEDW